MIVCVCLRICVCVMQAQTGETDVCAELNMKAAISATEHVHSTPLPEKVRMLLPVWGGKAI